MHFRPEPAGPVRLSGDAYFRGRGQALRGGADAAAVRAATVDRVETLRREGLLGSEARSFVDLEHRFASENSPEMLAELAGIADGYGISADVLFTYLFLGILNDLDQVARVAGDGCSAWAVGESADGPLAIKNRDFHGTHRGVQRVFRHEDPSWRAGPVLCVGSLGAPGAYSSGINAHGLALVDTQVGTDDHGVGWLRYFVMTRVLADCRTVTEAVDYVRQIAHAGGGCLVLADAAGNTAAIEIGHSAVAVELGPRSMRTNHYRSLELESHTLARKEDSLARSSGPRYARLAAAVPTETWTVERAARFMTAHSDSDPKSSLCQHGDGGSPLTISTSVFACATRTLYFCEGNPCLGHWRRYCLAD